MSSSISDFTVACAGSSSVVYSTWASNREIAESLKRIAKNCFFHFVTMKFALGDNVTFGVFSVKKFLDEHVGNLEIMRCGM